MKRLFLMSFLFLGACCTKPQTIYVFPDAPKELLTQPQQLKTIEIKNGTPNK